jgi:hypothetical protein
MASSHFPSVINNESSSLSTTRPISENNSLRVEVKPANTTKSNIEASKIAGTPSVINNESTSLSTTRPISENNTLRVDIKPANTTKSNIEASKKAGTLLKDYDNLKKLVDDIKKRDFIDDKISLKDLKGSRAYQDADKNIKDCINLGAKLGNNLRDDEILHCSDDANYFKDKS